MGNSRFYGDRDITGRLITWDGAMSQFNPEAVQIIDYIEDEYKALIEALDRKEVTA